MGSVWLRQGPQHCLAGIFLRSTLVACALGVGLLFAASSAQAALSVSGATLTYADLSTADANNIVVGFDGVSFTVSDSVPIDAPGGGGCLATGNTATCASAGVTRIVVNSGPKDDTVTIDPSVPANVSTNLLGGSGNDTLIGGNGDDTLNGQSGDDTMVGNGGTDTADFRQGPPGASLTELNLNDGFATGLGNDKLHAVGERPTIENVIGTPGNDTINVRNHGAVSSIVCGRGQDFVLSDPTDVVASDCEDNNDGVAPTIDFTSPEFTHELRPNIEFVISDKDPYDFQCWFDGAADPVPGCASPFHPTNDLSVEEHNLVVRATDKYGNSRGKTFTFTIDLTPPETQLDAVPPATVSTATPSFSYSSPDSDVAGFLCRFDAGNFFECRPPLVSPPLANGSHTFEVTAFDKAGNFDQTPASYTFTVNVIPPIASGNPNPKPPVGSLVLISGRSVKLVKGRFIPIGLTCSGQRTCSGTVYVRTDKRVKAAGVSKKSRRRVLQLGSKKFSIKGNRRTKVLVSVAKRKVKLLKRLKIVKVRAIIREVDLQGKPRISTRTFMLRAR